MSAIKTTSLIFLMALLAWGCASKRERQAQIRRAYAEGEQAARMQMEQAQTGQTPPLTRPPAQPQVRILGPVRNPVVMWYRGLTLSRALTLADYEKQTAPVAITIYRNNQPLRVDLQSLLQGQDYQLFPGDMIYIQD
ncbi:MAG TPA: hypothetical protein VN873_06020 [Candidatus Angelobacter sp.]|nr:hypothetical protein [Candidatus Angelobacter sp.]